MKKQIITAILLTISYLGFGQIYTPSQTIQGSSGSNNIGIGIANPLHKLTVAGNIAFNQNLVSRTQNAIINWGVGGPGYLSFRVLTGAENVLGNYIERMVINETGNVGIATTSGPTEKLHVNGTLRVDGTDGNGGVRIFKDGNAGITSHLYLGNVANNRAFNFQLNADGSAMTLWNYAGAAWVQKFSFTSNGYLGVGLADPQAAIHASTPTGSSASGLIVDHNYTSPYSFGTLVRVNNDQTKAIAVHRMNGSTPTTVFQVWGNGTVNAKTLYAEAITVTPTSMGTWPDYVFEKNYKLKSIYELENFVKENNHLPNVPSAKEVKESGVNLYEMNKALLEKVEEMSLYIIQLKKEVDMLNQKVK